MEESIKHKTKVGAYWQFSNQFLNYGMQFIIGIVMARLLSPQDYGTAALPAVFFAISVIFIDGGFGTAMVRKEELTDQDLSTAFYYSTLVGFFFYVILFIAAPWIAVFFDVPILSSLIRVSAISFLFAGFKTPQTILLNRRLDFKTPTIVTVISTLVMGVVGISTAYMGFGVWALVISNVVSGFLSLLLLWLFVRWIPKSGWSRESFNYLWGFGNKMIATLLIDKMYLNLAPFLIGKFYNPVQLGLFNRSQSYAQLPVQQIVNLLHNVSYPVLSKMQDDTEMLGRSYRRMLRLSTFIMFPIMILMAILAKPLILILITDKWIDCVPYLQLMCLAMMWYPIHSLNLALLLVKGRSDLFLKLEIIKAAIGLSIMAITLPFGIIPFLFGLIANSLICLFVNTYYTGKMIKLGFSLQMLDIFPTLMLSLFMGMVSYVVLSFITNCFLQLIIGGIFGLLVYGIGSYFFKFPEINDVKYMIHVKRHGG